jgi:mono/diheme cytochrome c family protein
MPTIRQASNPRQVRTGLLRHCLAGLAWLLALALPIAPARSEEPKAKSIQELRSFFQQNCVRCHGLDGSARNPEGKKLGGLDFTKAAQDFRTLSGPASEREIRTMIRTIRKGILFGYTMPAWKDQLSQEDAALMVREILLRAEAGKAIAPEAEAPRTQ